MAKEKEPKPTQPITLNFWLENWFSDTRRVLEQMELFVKGVTNHFHTKLRTMGT